jgi:hexosaminidase
MKRISTILIILLSMSFHIEAQQKVTIVPQPQSVKYLKGISNIKISNISCPKEFINEAVFLKNELSQTNKSIIINNKGEKASVCLMKGVFKAPQNAVGAYRLEIKNNKISITAAESSGIFYGIQSLLQVIFPSTQQVLELPNLCIEDYPAFQWRAFMLDEARYFKGKEIVKDLLDRMSRLKMNVFQWHLTDDQGWRIEIKKYPKLTEIGSRRDSSQISTFEEKQVRFDGRPHCGFYTQNEIKEIVEYAKARHITIVPEIEMPGHATAAIAAYPWLGVTGKPVNVSCYWGSENYNIYNVADPKVYDFLNDVLDEVIALFPSKVIHIGGDEVRYKQWMESDYVKKYMKQNNLSSPSDLQINFTNRISNLIKEKGRSMMGWNEITGAKLHTFQVAEDTTSLNINLAKGTIVHFWKGDNKLIQQTAEKGFDIVNSYHAFTYLDYDYKTIPLSKAYSFNAIPETLPNNLKKRILGAGCQMWSEFVPTREKMYNEIFPRIVAYAEGDWTLAKNKDFKRFQNSLEIVKKNPNIYPDF